MTTYTHGIRQALAETITDGDLKLLIATTREKARHNAAIAAELKALPENRGKATFSIQQHYCLYQLWRLIMLGTFDPEKHRVHPYPFIPQKTSSQWMHILFRTIDSHFSGQIADVAKMNTINFLNLFLQGQEVHHATFKNINFPIYTSTASSSVARTNKTR